MSGLPLYIYHTIDSKSFIDKSKLELNSGATFDQKFIDILNTQYIIEPNISINFKLQKILKKIQEYSEKNPSIKKSRFEVSEILDDKFKIFTGGHGCVYHPSIKCLDNKEINTVNKYKFVTKLLSTQEADKEIKIAHILEKADSKYFILAGKEKCKKLDISKENLDKCLPIKSMKSYDSIYMPYGGIDLMEWLVANKPKDKSLTEKAFTNFLTQALDGLSVLHSLKVCHLDIKPANLIIDSGTIRYIDFGLSIINGIETEKYKTFYWIWPPDYIIRNHISDSKIQPKDIVNILSNGYKPLEFKDLNPFITHGIDITVESILDLNSKAEELKSKNRVDYFKSIDIYGLAIAFMFGYNYLGIKPCDMIKDLFLKMVDIEPEKRLINLSVYSQSIKNMIEASKVNMFK